MTNPWPRRSYLELGALPGAVPCARLHARHLLREWGQADLAETAELLISELDIAERYEASRPGYPARVTEFVITTARLDPGATILEIDCGTGQLIEQLVTHGFRLTAIDIGPAIEDLVAAGEPFGLVISSAASHSLRSRA